jgi:hypothetical protein
LGYLRRNKLGRKKQLLLSARLNEFRDIWIDEKKKNKIQIFLTRWKKVLRHNKRCHNYWTWYVLQQIKRVGLSFIHLVFCLEISVSSECVSFLMLLFLFVVHPLICSKQFEWTTHTQQNRDVPRIKKFFNGQENFDSFFFRKI